MSILKYFRAFKRFADATDVGEPVRARQLNKEPAPAELFDLMATCIAAHTQQGLAALAVGEDVGHSWRHVLEELVHSSAFDEMQTNILVEKINEAEREIALKKVHINATRIICGAQVETHTPINITTTTGVVRMGKTYITKQWK